MLVDAVVVAGDRACPDVDVGPDCRIAQIGQMIGLGPGPEVGLLQLDEVADFGLFTNRGLGPQVSERTDRRPVCNLRAG